MEKKRLDNKLRKRQIQADAAEMKAAEVKAAAKEVGPGSPWLTMNTISRSVLDGARYPARLRHC
jgi:nucleoside phosphorylase